ncbi:IscS subfamily cysteine desulfurase [Bacillus sp. FJAT-49736]|uniref:IscS subfamily cysteine desulfurase n=1 Tax=Bacillus sp. FJAT-49736 TaxID=2833582 RepID=UPI001BC946B3|nr:IscS subfamily cysteine desulfurase [Bacillus sp. FJAT-49736]MBS4173684.1 IscS subfamily cysteine desulfurase [Bacillus sp. FJAT-49736]
MLYFDYAATTPMDEEVLSVYGEIAKNIYGNTSSLHNIGANAEQVLDKCRTSLANMLQVHRQGIYFTSGGTEGNLLSIISLAKSSSKKGKHIITSIGEHASVHSAIKFLKMDGFEISCIPYTPDGIIDIQALKAEIRPDTILITIQHVNSELGTIQPIRDISAITRERNILFHCDCVQSFGKINIAEISPLIDSLTISSHKIYGPKGVGAVYVNPKLHIVPVFPGFHHENGFRGGTVNVPGIAAFIFAAQKIQTENKQKTYEKLRDIFLYKLNSHPDRFEIFQASDKNKQLPQIIGLCVTGLEGQLTMLECNRNGYAISTGSACQVGQQEPSQAMKALRIDNQRANEFIRITFGKETKECHVAELADYLIQLSFDMVGKNILSNI